MRDLSIAVFKHLGLTHWS